MLVSSPPGGGYTSGQEVVQGPLQFYSLAFEVKSFHVHPAPFDKYCFSTVLDMTVPGGCRSHGCHGYPMHPVQIALNNVHGQTSVHIFAPNGRYCLYM